MGPKLLVNKEQKLLTKVPEHYHKLMDVVTDHYLQHLHNMC